jgi:predicted nicotinamide N-methyase
VTLRLAGFTAELVEIDLPTNRHVTRSLPIYRVADLERHVDRDALLRGTDLEEPPYWALVWCGARAIAADLLDFPPEAHSTVLDLGCGLGLSGVAAGLAGASVVFADIAEEALAFAAANADLHRLKRYRTLRLDFTRARLDGRFDLVLAADVVYDPAHYASLVRFLDAHLAEDGAILLTESLRADARQVIAALTRSGFESASRAVWVDEDGRAERTWLHTLRRVRASSLDEDHSSGRN